jgi:hypothetical protein
MSRIREKDKIPLYKMIERTSFDKVIEYLYDEEVLLQIYASVEPRKRVKKYLMKLIKNLSMIIYGSLLVNYLTIREKNQ